MPIEDFTTYTEYDEGNDIAVASDKVTVDTMQFYRNSYVGKDFGADYFADIDITVKVLGTWIYVCYHETPRLGVMALDGASLRSWYAFTAPYIKVYFQWNGSASAITMVLQTDQGSDTSCTLADSTPYWIRLTRTAGTQTVTLKIYSDEAMTTLVDVLSAQVTATSSKFRCLYAASSAGGNVGPEHADAASGYTEDMIVRSGGGGPIWML